VGIWRSATRQILENRQPFWGALAKLSLVLFFLNQVAPIAWVYYPRAREHWNDIAGRDIVGPYQIQVSSNGEVIEFRGGIRFGSAKALQNALQTSPNAKVLRIESTGGRTGEALRMMGMIRERKLATFAVQECLSAATLLLTAGKERGAQEGTRIGFHTSRSSSGNSKLSDASIMGSMLSAGISEEFVRRVLSVPPDRMWYPTAEQMLQAGVLTSYGVFPPQGSTNTTLSVPVSVAERHVTEPSAEK
jgi:hypothetical protein